MLVAKLAPSTGTRVPLYLEVPVVECNLPQVQLLNDGHDDRGGVHSTFPLCWGNTLYAMSTGFFQEA